MSQQPPSDRRNSLDVVTTWIIRIGIALTLLTLPFVARGLWDHSRRQAVRDNEPIRMPQVGGRPDFLQTGTELVAVYIVSSQCAASRDERFPGTVARINAALARQAAQKGLLFSRRGVALDGQPAAGLRFLNRLGVFEELDLGHNWLNSQALAYVWRDSAGFPALPQLVVLRRQVNVSPKVIAVGPDAILLRKKGVDDIEEWAKAGAPLSF